VSDVVVRPARAEEVDAAGALAVSGYDADGHLTRADGTYDHEYAAWLADGAARARGAVLLVATVDDALAGTITWCPHGSAFAELAKRPDQGEIRMLAVAATARRRGVARALVEECLRTGRAAGLHEVLLSSLTTMTSAHRLYEALGFGRRPDLDWSPGPGIDLLGFGLRLDAR
jgi:ribosomal protein S18 acetylase RimI-like enzyme